MRSPDRGQLGFINRWRDAVLSTQGPCRASARLVAIAVARYASTSTAETFVGAEQLGSDTALDEKTVRRALNELIEEKWLSAKQRRRSRGWKLRTFRLQFPAGVPDNLPGTRRHGTGNLPGTSGATDAPGATPGTRRDAADNSSPWSGHSVPMVRAKCPTNSVLTLKENSERAGGAAAPEGAAPPARATGTIGPRRSRQRQAAPEFDQAAARRRVEKLHETLPHLLAGDLAKTARAPIELVQRILEESMQ